jgi:DNA polymerase III subunit alpha
MLVRVAHGSPEVILPKLEWLTAQLPRFRGTCPVHISFRDAAGRKAEFKLGREFGVNPANVVVEELEQVFGPGAILFTR